MPLKADHVEAKANDFLKMAVQTVVVGSLSFLECYGGILRRLSNCSVKITIATSDTKWQFKIVWIEESIFVNDKKEKFLEESNELNIIVEFTKFIYIIITYILTWTCLFKFLIISIILWIKYLKIFTFLYLKLISYPVII